MFATLSLGIARIPFLGAYLDAGVRRCRWWSSARGIATVVGWGKRPTAAKAQKFASNNSLPLVRLEDGFLRSFGTGNRFPPLAIVADEQGIYYDATSVSALESMLQSERDLLAGIEVDVASARVLIASERLSKYNHGAALTPAVLRDDDSARVLVIDQTRGDLSVSLGLASEATFAAMLVAAYAENPGATIYVKTHPEVAAGRKAGYLSGVEADERTVVVREAISPLSLIEHMDRVYVVTSTMGFEALLVGKPVTCFGLPWYAGWGVTDDRQLCPRRTCRRSVDELFAAAYFHYTRYLNPETRQRGTIFDVIDWLIRQKQMAARYSGRMICVGFRRWKAANMKPLLSLFPERVVFVRNASAAERLIPHDGDCLVHWGAEAPPGLSALAQRCGARLLRMEDGFIRSVGLGSDLICPMSLVLDERGIYFDPAQESDLEQLLNTREFNDNDRSRAHQVREFIVANGLTKYNIEPRARADWPHDGREVVLVPGQVEDDASIRLGCTDVCTNLDLLCVAREAHPNAFIVFKPHPDVSSGNRKGRLTQAAACQFADHVETQLSVVSCIEACDVVHTMTSLTGFDALLRGKRVVVYGQPFYAGWGLTEDKVQLPRRRRRLSLDELVAGALLHYPLYWDWELKGYTTCEAVLRRIVETRQQLEASGELARLRVGYLRRQLRKANVLVRTWWHS